MSSTNSWNTGQDPYGPADGSTAAAATLRAPYAIEHLVVAFPAAPERVLRALSVLRKAANGSAEEKKALGPLESLPRPWVLASCPEGLRAAIWQWLEQVVVWHNHEYVWPAERAIPACWDWHPHIVHELAVLAFLRLDAEASPELAAMEEWHRHSRPQFLDRLHTQLGPNGCGKEHQHWPGSPRWHKHISSALHMVRHNHFAADHDEADGRSDTERSDGTDFLLQQDSAAAPPWPGADSGPVAPSWVDPATGTVNEQEYPTGHDASTMQRPDERDWR